MTRTDEQLFSDYVDGCNESFSALFDRYSEPLVAYVAKRLRGDRGLAQDVVQQVWIKIIEHRQEFQQGRAFKPWLYTIADRSAWDMFRKELTRRRHTARISDLGDVHVDPRVDETPADIAEVNEASHQIMSLMDHLPNDVRLCLQFTIIDGMTSRECGDALGCSHMTAQRRAFEGLNTLRSRMGWIARRTH